MRNTKIVIDKEDWDKIASEFNSNDLPTVTEIQIDQSIEEISDKMHIEKHEQEMEEFNLFVSANFMYSFEEKKWYHNHFAKHNSVHYEKHYTFTELLTKFKNR